MINLTLTSSSSTVAAVQENKISGNQNQSISTENECSICINKINNKATLPCGHEFDQICINNALHQNMRCALCRQDPYKAKNLRDNVSKEIDGANIKAKNDVVFYLPITIWITQQGKTKKAPVV